MSWGRWVNLICVVKVTGNNVLWVWECTSSRHNVSVHLSKTNQGGSDTMESRSTIFTCSGCGSVHQVDTMLVYTSVKPTREGATQWNLGVPYLRALGVGVYIK